METGKTNTANSENGKTVENAFQQCKCNYDKYV